MSQVTLQVGGRPYTLACADGEEGQVRRLAAVVDGKISSIASGLPPGDAKALLFAALVLADEAEEGRRAVRQPASDQAVGNEAVTRGLETLADRLEAVAATLENPPPSA